MEVLILALVIPLVFGGLFVTDKLGWTAVYRKREDRGSSLGIGMMSLEHTFAEEKRRAAIEYRLQDKQSLHQQQAGDGDPEPDPRA